MMNRKNIICSLVLIGVLVLLTGCSRGIRGTGEMVTRDFEVEDFSALEIRGAYEVTWRQSDIASVTVEMQENLFDYLQVSVEEDMLYVSSTRNFNTRNRNRPRIYIYSPDLETVSFFGAINAENWDTITGEKFAIYGAGASNVDISLAVENLNLGLEGAGNFNLEGNADAANIIVLGAVDVSARNLQIEDANIELGGAGVVDIAVSDHLSVDLSGVGRVQYSGNPTVYRNISGLGRLEQR